MIEDSTNEIQPLGRGEPSGEKVTPEESIETGTHPNLEDSLGVEDPFDVLKAEVEESNREKNQFREMLQRVQADFINYKRRTEEEREEQQKYTNSRLILKLLPVLDEFNLAIDHTSRSEAEAPWLEGIKLIHRKLYSLLESENVTRIEVEGEEFDPFEHEAMAYQESADHQEGQILTVVRDGYKLHGRVIRPAMVILAKNPGTTEEGLSSPEEGSPSTGKETEDA